MGKDKKNKKQVKKSKALEPAVKSKSPLAASTKPKRAKVAKAAKLARTKAVDLASNPLVAEVVAAALVAAAAAIKNPKTARAMAATVGDELESAGKGAADGGGAFWQLALDIARRSIDTLGADAGKSGKKTKK